MNLFPLIFQVESATASAYKPKNSRHKAPEKRETKTKRRYYNLGSDPFTSPKIHFYPVLASATKRKREREREREICKFRKQFVIDPSLEIPKAE